MDEKQPTDTQLNAVYEKSIKEIKSFMPFAPSNQLLSAIRDVSDTALKNAFENAAKTPQTRAPASAEEMKALNHMLTVLIDEFNGAAAGYPVTEAFMNPRSELNKDIRAVIEKTIKAQHNLDYKLGMSQYRRI